MKFKRKAKPHWEADFDQRIKKAFAFALMGFFIKEIAQSLEISIKEQKDKVRELTTKEREELK